MKAVKVIVAIAAIAFAVFVVYHFQQRRQLAQWNNQATQLIGQERYDEALPLLEKARAKDASNHVIWKNLGTVYDGLGRPKEALEAYQRSLGINPQQPEVQRRVEELRKELKAAGA